MSKWAADAVMDAALDYIATCTIMFACSAQPTTYTEANTLYDGGASKYKLASVVLSGADFTKADGDSNGRKVTVAQKTGVSVAASATATHVALGISGSSTLVYVTTCTNQALTSGNTMTFNSWKIEFGDPS